MNKWSDKLSSQVIPCAGRIVAGTFDYVRFEMPSCKPCGDAGYDDVDAVKRVGFTRIPMCATCWPLAPRELIRQGMVDVERNGDKPKTEDLKLKTKTENTMNDKRRRCRVDLVSFRKDYESDMPGDAIATKYGIAIGSLTHFSKRAGAKPRSGSRAGRAHQVVARETPDLPMRLKAPEIRGSETMVSVVMSERALDALWAGFDIKTKAHAIELICSASE